MIEVKVEMEVNEKICVFFYCLFRQIFIYLS